MLLVNFIYHIYTIMVINLDSDENFLLWVPNFLEYMYIKNSIINAIHISFSLNSSNSI